MNQPKTYTYSHAYTQHNWYTFSTHLYWLSGLSQRLLVMALVCFIDTAWTIQGFCMQVFFWTNEFISSCISSEHCCFILTQSQARFIQSIAKMRKMCYLVLVISFGLCSNVSLCFVSCCVFGVHGCVFNSGAPRFTFLHSHNLGLVSVA